MITQQNKKGFTIIEVILVLAIAGLIFLMVFVALRLCSAVSAIASGAVIFRVLCRKLIVTKQIMAAECHLLIKMLWGNS